MTAKQLLRSLEALSPERTKIGAAILWLRQDRYTVVGTGFNRPNPLRQNGLIVHAEISALWSLEQFDTKQDLTLVCTLPPCLECAQSLLSREVRNIRYCGHAYDKWRQSGSSLIGSVERSMKMLSACRVPCQPLTDFEVSWD